MFVCKNVLDFVCVFVPPPLVFSPLMPPMCECKNMHVFVCVLLNRPLMPPPLVPPPLVPSVCVFVCMCV